MTSRKKIEELFFKCLMVLSLLAVMGSLVLIIGTVIYKGAGSMSLDMITSTPEGGYYLGKKGGILNAIAGSLILTGIATVAAIALALPLALYINLYRARRSRFAEMVRLSMDFLWGIPSIVYGAFGFSVMIFLGIRASLLGGIIAVTLLIIPIMARAIDEAVSLVPRELLDSSYSLGATRFEAAFKIVVRQCLPGIVSAVLIAFGRGIGDAASVLFTAGFSDRIPLSLSEPAATLPLAIFFQLGTPFPEVRDRAYASALILTVIILALSITARVLASRFNRHIIK
ncbi:MAG TPA: phosphate ABC transporter permease PstA [Spirochaetota bacterium]|nr:phosphate ABC transporter permease PstA [Spirochaetota bacterium]HRZ27508.1 phosphate ABC transporter permease PstA [Spirochaetota bacterium]HSA16395.1 phosphate ABC transporter permease PstA [Spirochaetota bacterium]